MPAVDENVGSAAKLALVSPFTNPEYMAVNFGTDSPDSLFLFTAVIVSGAGRMVKLPGT